MGGNIQPLNALTVYSSTMEHSTTVLVSTPQRGNLTPAAARMDSLQAVGANNLWQQFQRVVGNNIQQLGSMTLDLIHDA